MTAIPLYNEVLGITNDIFQPGLVKCMEQNLGTVEPRFNEVPRDWRNWFVISGYFAIHYTFTGMKTMLRYTEDFVI